MTGAVALLAEGVDRNFKAVLYKDGKAVALLAEGVDRNAYAGIDVYGILASPSSRRAWIEMSLSLMSVPAGSGRPPRGGRG